MLMNHLIGEIGQRKCVCVQYNNSKSKNDNRKKNHDNKHKMNELF